MKHRILFVLIMVLAAMQASAYTVTTVAEAPQWQIDWSGNEVRPDWQEPDAGAFENWVVMLVKIEEALLPYVSADDMMAIFVGDELRGLSRPATVVSTGEVDASQFLLKAFSNENYGDEVAVTMKYYNAQLKQMFSLSETIIMDEDEMYGFDEDFIPPFTLGSPKYPVVTTLDVAPFLAEAAVTPAEGDIVAAFVGNKCRGVTNLSPATVPGNSPSGITVFLRRAKEPVTLKYYDASDNCVYTFGGSYTPDVCDTTGDGVVDEEDISYIMDMMAKGTNDPKADVNGDGVVNVADIVTVMNNIAAQESRVLP